MTALKGRQTLYKGIKMRSRLEADYAAELDRQRYRWEYEPECFASEAGQWLPDFGCTYNPGPLVIFDEVKPAEPLKKHIPGSVAFVQHVDAVLSRMMIALASRPDANLRLTFWQYGEGPFLTLNLTRARLWYANFGVQDMWLIWPGMGQSEQCRGNANQDLARRWRGLVGPMAAHAWPGELRSGVLVIYADSEEWAARARRSAESRLMPVLNLILGSDSVRRIDVQLDEVARS